MFPLILEPNWNHCYKLATILEPRCYISFLRLSACSKSSWIVYMMYWNTSGTFKHIVYNICHAHLSLNVIFVTIATILEPHCYISFLRLSACSKSSWIVYMIYWNTSVQCTMYSVQCTVYNLQCTMHSVQSTMYNIQCRGVQCTMYTVHCAM